MIGFVIDASALLEVVAGREPDRDLLRAVRTAAGAAPELIDIEVVHALRRLVLAGAMRPDDACEAVEDVTTSPISRTSHRPLVGRIWELRGAVTAYDATYVALAEQLDVPLLTCDARLGRANGHRADIVVYPRS